MRFLTVQIDNMGRRKTKKLHELDTQSQNAQKHRPRENILGIVKKKKKIILLVVKRTIVKYIIC